jgi:hypothetical protein
MRPGTMLNHLCRVRAIIIALLARLAVSVTVVRILLTVQLSLVGGIALRSQTKRQANIKLTSRKLR